MPIKTIEVSALPGPGFVDADGKLIDYAKVTEILFPEKNRVFNGDSVLAIEKDGIVKNHLKRELSYILSPVSGRITRYHVKVKDTIRVGQALYDIDTMDEYNAPLIAAIYPPPKVVEKKKKKLEYLQIPKTVRREYRLVQNEVDSLQDEIKILKRRMNQIISSENVDPTNKATTTPKLVNTTGPPTLTPEISKLIHDQIEIYERILAFKNDAYNKTINSLITPDTDEDLTLQYQRINDSDPLDIGPTYRSMGLLYLLLEKYDVAHDYMKDAVLWRRKKNRYGNFQHFDLLQDVLVHLGTIKYRQSDIEGARRSLYEAFQLQTRFLGHSYHPIIANTVHLLGQVNYDLGKKEDALKSYQVAKKVFNEIGVSIKGEHIRNVPQIPSAHLELAKSIDELQVRYKIETAKVLHNLSIVHERMGQRKEAIMSATQELRLRKSVLPANDITIATCHYMIGDLLVADGGQQKKDPPMNHYESALAIYESNYGYNHKTVAMTYISIGTLCLLQKKYDDAHESYIKGIEILEATEGKNNPDVASAYLYAGQALFDKGKDSYDGALKYFLLAYRSLESVTITTKVIRAKSIDDPEDKGYNIQLILISAIESIGNVYKGLGSNNEAIRFYDEALTLLVSKIGRRRHDVARLYYVLAQTLLEEEDYDESLKMFNTAKDIFSSIYGDRHSETASCYYKIGLVLKRFQNRNVEALESLQNARARWLRVFGSDHANVMEVEKCIDDLEQQFDAGIGVNS